MDYELLEKLRKAGFPFKHSEGETMIVIFPSSSELKEACGSKLGDVHGYYVDIGNTRHEYWVAFPNLSILPSMKEVRGDTEEEALTRFYLELNKNLPNEAEKLVNTSDQLEKLEKSLTIN